MPRPKGSKNKPKTGVVDKPVKEAKKTKTAVVELVKEEATAKKSTSAAMGKQGEVVIKASKDSDDSEKQFHVVLRGGKAVKVQDSEDPEID